MPSKSIFMQNSTYNITLLLLGTTFLILLMAVIIIVIVFLYRKRQMAYLEKINEIKTTNEKELLTTKLEIQEQTFQHISREIHDNISLSLTLVKLHLNTFEWEKKSDGEEKLNSSIELLSKSITELSNISKSLNADIIIQHGLLKAVEEEMGRIRAARLLNIKYEASDNTVFMDCQKELIIYRIIQEAFNNILKHADAANARLLLDYNSTHLTINITDDGKGFVPANTLQTGNAGLNNMQSRVKMLEGSMNISSQPGTGTTILFTIPID